MLPVQIGEWEFGEAARALLKSAAEGANKLERMKSNRQERHRHIVEAASLTEAASIVCSAIAAAEKFVQQEDMKGRRIMDHRKPGGYYASGYEIATIDSLGNTKIIGRVIDPRESGEIIALHAAASMHNNTPGVSYRTTQKEAVSAAVIVQQEITKIQGNIRKNALRQSLRNDALMYQSVDEAKKIIAVMRKPYRPRICLLRLPAPDDKNPS